MQVTDSSAFSLLTGASASRAQQFYAASAVKSADGQKSSAAAGSSQPAPTLAPSPANLASTSVINALLNEQSIHGQLVYGKNGAPDLMASLVASQPAAYAKGEATDDSGSGMQFISHADDGSTDATSLSGYSDSDVAEDLIRQAGSSGTLKLADVLKKMQVDVRTKTGEAIAKTVSEAWNKLSHGQDSLSSADLTLAIHSYRAVNGDGIGAGGAAYVQQSA